MTAGSRRRLAESGPWLALCACLAVPPAEAGAGDALADTIDRIKPGIVGVGTYSVLRRPAAALHGTGFVVGDGKHAATNHHVVTLELDVARNEQIVVFVGRGRRVEYRPVTIAAVDPEHDLALLAFDGEPLPPLALDTRTRVREGASVAFTGFPIGAVLGLYPVTHQGIVSALTPIAIPAAGARELSVDKIATLRDPYDVIQLDATAYPGNSGSPVFWPDSGGVIGVINQVFVKGKKEDVLSDPSAITYAIPAAYLERLLARLRSAP